MLQALLQQPCAVKRQRNIRQLSFRLGRALSQAEPRAKTIRKAQRDDGLHETTITGPPYHTKNTGKVPNATPRPLEITACEKCRLKLRYVNANTPQRRECASHTACRFQRRPNFTRCTGSARNKKAQPFAGWAFCNLVDWITG